MRSNQGTLESRMQGNPARPVWGWGPGEIPRPTPLFVASLTGGRRAAILFSLIASAKANQVEPWAWLRDVFTRLPSILADTDTTGSTDTSADTTALDALLPDR